MKRTYFRLLLIIAMPFSVFADQEKDSEPLCPPSNPNGTITIASNSIINKCQISAKKIIINNNTTLENTVLIADTIIANHSNQFEKVSFIANQKLKFETKNIIKDSAINTSYSFVFFEESNIISNTHIDSYYLSVLTSNKFINITSFNANLLELAGANNTLQNNTIYAKHLLVDDKALHSQTFNESTLEGNATNLSESDFSMGNASFHNFKKYNINDF